MERDASGRFLTGNKAALGKRGFKDRGRQLARMFTQDDIELVYKTIMSNVANGDASALSLICRYIACPIKPTFSVSAFDYDGSSPLKGAESIMTAVASGALPADVGRCLIDCIASITRIQETVELEARLQELELKLEK